MDKLTLAKKLLRLHFSESKLVFRKDTCYLMDKHGGKSHIPKIEKAFYSYVNSDTWVKLPKDDLAIALEKHALSEQVVNEHALYKVCSGGSNPIYNEYVARFPDGSYRKASPVYGIVDVKDLS